MKIAITGASGFIGSNLSRNLTERGYDVIDLIRSVDKVQRLQKEGLDVRVCDVSDLSSLTAAFCDVEVVVHLAALFNTPEASAKDFYRVNVKGTENVLVASLQCRVRRVLHCSTVGVATTGNPPYSEETPYSRQKDKYEKTKREAEILALDFHRKSGLPLVIIRPGQVYGPGDKGKARFYKMVKKGIVINPGDTMKHLVYVDDLCRAFELAIRSEKAVGQTFIIAGEKATALKDLVALVAKELGVPSPKIRVPATPIRWLCAATESLCQPLGIKPPVFRRSMDFFTKSVEFDVAKAQSLLGFRADVDVPTGVARTAMWYRQNGFL